ncbi:MAG TPA: DUF1553 domain-containing protein [Planctomycetes bacterium]|nr:DUF1553 domain-containing protein [Fuerstiella sp.]HIK90750.1 DUF1553 domain-containing protein [Planctomycetota bacterium]
MTVTRNYVPEMCVFILASMAVSPIAAQEEQVNFGRQIRPLLAEKCFACHGLDSETRETEFRMDTRDGLFAPLDSGGVAIVPGDLETSVIYQRLITDDEDAHMPPVDTEKQFSKNEIDLVRRWIKQGAEWQQHWAWVAPERPQLADAASHNAIDFFVQGRLKKEGLKTSSEANRVTLIRRVTFDLTGLPPTAGEIDNFLADKSSNAYETVVNRLLKSPHYGEQMGRYWLDAARYGDTHGLHLDNFREMWPYRDWVINAFNKNMSFDQFTIEQLAGDLLPDATVDQQVATGFNRCNVTTSEGGAINEEYHAHYTVDRVATISTVWMGVSMGCVVCHDHKFDPYQMKDFYQLYAFFNSLDGPVMDGNKKDTAPVLKIASDAQQAEMADLNHLIAELSKTTTAPNVTVDQAQAEWEKQLQTNVISEPEWVVLSPETSTSSGGATLTRQEDESILVSGENPAKEVYEFIAQVESKGLTAVRVEGLLHPSLTAGGAGRSSNSNVVLSEFEAEVASTVEPDKWEKIKFTKAWADHEPPDGNFKIGNTIDGKAETGWAVGGHQRKEDRTAIFVADAPFGHEEGTRLKLRLRHESIYSQHQFGRIRLAVTDAAEIPQIGSETVPAKIADLLKIEPKKRSDEQQNTIRDHYRNTVSTDETLIQNRTDLAAKRKRQTELDKSLPTTLVWKELAEPKPAHILIRGAYDKKGDLVYRNTPAALPPLAPLGEGETPTRLHLAQWLVAPDHPLTSRVTVNRFWQQYFGVGIVQTTEDFGSQGSPPSHPELLDWLAVDFQENGWDVKRLQKQIVMSSTYRQSSQVPQDPQDLRSLDPDNRLLSRGPRFRFDAEMIRDNALSLSGLLIDRIGGPSVKPYQPPGIWFAVAYTDSDTAKFKRDSGEALYRRSMYTFWKRTAPPPTMVTFDAPSRETCSVRRSRTNTPLAALALMNDEQFVEASRGIGQRIMTESGSTDEDRAEFAFRLVTARRPSNAELAVVLKVYRTSLAAYVTNEKAAQKLLAVGDSTADSSLKASQLAAWTMVANMLLNLDETITKG